MPKRGNCYVTSEALYHLLGGKNEGWVPQVVHHEGGTHWYLKHRSGRIIDLTASQFSIPPPYKFGRGKGFLTREPSRKAKLLMNQLVYGSEKIEKGSLRV